MKQLLLVFLGGGTGSVLRFLISRSLNRAEVLPLGTFTVNILGSLLIGLVLGLAYRHNFFSTNAVLLLATGFCGGFTTFSALAYENQIFLKNGDFLSFGIYVVSTVAVGIAAIYAGIWLSRYVAAF
ncbi:fluoride efflux transporter CrcB [Salinimicrobium soli]|uniref:fluoride efflux transporter CrcB n=1 Tax=Salinimicrobium soli TaxID=1254399 RepID=UPI003AAA9E47